MMDCILLGGLRSTCRRFPGVDGVSDPMQRWCEMSMVCCRSPRVMVVIRGYWQCRLRRMVYMVVRREEGVFSCVDSCVGFEVAKLICVDNNDNGVGGVGCGRHLRTHVQGGVGRWCWI